MLTSLFDAFFVRSCIACQEPVAISPLCLSCTSLLNELKLESTTPTQALFHYRGLLQILVKEAKFQPSELKAAQLMKAVDSCAQLDELLQSISFDAITFIPLHAKRLLGRTYNLAFVFASLIQKTSKKPLFDLLTCKKYTAPLTFSLDRATRAQLSQGKYAVRKVIPSRRLLLVDDIVTTGATFHSATQPLLNCGHTVIQLALAKTPLKKAKPCEPSN